MKSVRSVRICVAEDEPKILQNIVKKIQMSGTEFSVVTTARNGVEALRGMDEETPDVLITDIVMPMMDGLALIKEVRKRYPHTHVVIVSGHDDFQYAKTALRYGVDDYLLKPLRVETLKETLSKISERLLSDAHDSAREELFSVVHGKTSVGAPGLKETRICVLLVCIGNVHLLPADETIGPDFLAFLNECWANVRRNIERCVPWKVGRWWMIDDDAPNQKFLLLEAPAGVAELQKGAVQALHRAVEASFRPFPAKLCYSLEATGIDGVHSTANRARHALSECAEIGASQMVDIDLTEDAPAMHLDEGLHDLDLLQYLGHGDLDSCVLRTKELLATWLDEHPNQARFVERMRKLADAMCPEPEEGVDSRRTIAGIVASALVEHATRAEFTSVVSQAVGTLLVLHAAQLTPERLATLIGQYIERNYHRQVDFAAMSEIFGYSVSYLSRTFRRFRGIPPVRYLSDLRIGNAKRLLLQHPELDISVVGASVGFPDQHYFSRIFKKRTGSTPTAFRATGAGRQLEA